MKERLLVGVCCAACAKSALHHLKENFNVSIFFYNPSIASEEYKKKLGKIREIAKDSGLPLILGESDRARWKSQVAQDDFPCMTCMDDNIDEVARTAEENGFDSFATTFGNDSSIVQEILKEKQKKYGIGYLELPSSEHCRCAIKEDL